MTFSKRFGVWATQLKHRLVRVTSNVYSNATMRIFVAFFFSLYVVNFVVNAIATLFRELQTGQTLFSSSVAQELLSLFFQTTHPFMAAGLGGILTIMLFILVVSYLLTRLLLAPLKEASDKQRLFAANASHELRTPLSVLKTLAEVTRMRSANLSKEEIEKFTEDIGEEVDRMSHIIEFFVQFSALEDGAQKLQLAPVRLSRLAESVARTLEHTAKEHGVTITIARDMPGIVRGNFTALEEMLANLVKNAITFSQKGGVVRISAKVKNGHVSLTVADNGRGVSEEDLPHIFEPFYQSESKKYGKGSGLGLTLVKQIAKLHHAKIEVRSKVGAGTIFTVEFPE